jgi:probable rRNA maturation factor
MASIRFFSEEINFKLHHPFKTSSWIKLVIQKEKKTLASLSYIFCSDSHLLNLNETYLKHSTFTDIITFDFTDHTKEINGEIYISIERVTENARKFKTSFDEELHRVIIHGVLHLVGYNDNNSSKKAQIRKKEEAYLSLRS